jgi:hypothetical protein
MFDTKIIILLIILFFIINNHKSIEHFEGNNKNLIKGENILSDIKSNKLKCKCICHSDWKKLTGNQKKELKEYLKSLSDKIKNNDKHKQETDEYKILGRDESTWGPAIHSSEEEILGRDESTWGPAIHSSEEEILGRDESTWGPTIHSSEEEILGRDESTWGPAIHSSEEEILGRDESTWGPAIHSSEEEILGRDESTWGPANNCPINYKINGQNTNYCIPVNKKK